MANEITANLQVQINNGDFREMIMPPAMAINQATLGRGGGVQHVNSVTETLSFGDVATPGLCFLQNLSNSKYVTFTMTGKLNPGEWGVMRVAPSTLINATGEDTNTIPLDVRIYSD